VFWGVGDRAAKTLTLHNYRLVCPNAIPMRNGKVCTACFEKAFPWPSLIHRCYRNSLFADAPIALSVWLHKVVGTWRDQVDAFICLSEFQRDALIAVGFPAERVYVKPNFFSGDPQPVPWTDREPYAVFAGRLSPEKGVMRLVEAWQQWGSEAPELRIAGDGPLKEELMRSARSAKIRFLGQLDPAQTHSVIARARLLLMPSEWFEGFPMTIAEAFAHGTTVATSGIGPLPGIVQDGVNGLVFNPGDPESLLAVVKKAWETPGLLERLGQGARKSFVEKYTEEANYNMLMEIYAKAIENRKKRLAEMKVK